MAENLHRGQEALSTDYADNADKAMIIRPKWPQNVFGIVSDPVLIPYPLPRQFRLVALPLTSEWIPYHFASLTPVYLTALASGF